MGYDVLDVRLWSSLRVEHYKFSTLHRNYEQNPMKRYISIYTCIRLNKYLGKAKSYVSIKTYSKL
jgi:hypothetical protein